MGAELHPHTQIYTHIHTASRKILFSLFQIGRPGRFWAYIGAKMPAAFLYAVCRFAPVDKSPGGL